MKTIKFVDLPDDMQVLIGQFADDFAPDGPAAKENWERMDFNYTIKRVPVRNFPCFPITGMFQDCRGGPKHAMGMVGHVLPPVILYDGLWLDGRHRIWMARRPV